VKELYKLCKGHDTTKADRYKLKMAAFRPRITFKSTNVASGALRRSIATKATQKSFLIPAAITASSALLGGAAAYLYHNNSNVFSVLPIVQASAPKADKCAERTFIMIKPDGVKRGLIADIIKRFEQRGYKLVALKMMQPDSTLLNEHYGDLKTKAFFPGLIRHITSGPVVAMVWEGKDVVKQGRQMLGETDPLKSKPGSIRGDYSIDMGRNIIHGSDSVESANIEIDLWFKKAELMDFKLPVHGQVFE